MYRINISMAAATNPAAGTVRIQEENILLNMGQGVFFDDEDSPTPVMAPVTVWVVDTGRPHWVAANIMIAALVSAAEPRSGVKCVIFLPMV